MYPTSPPHAHLYCAIAYPVQIVLPVFDFLTLEINCKKNRLNKKSLEIFSKYLNDVSFICLWSHFIVFFGLATIKRRT